MRKEMNAYACFKVIGGAVQMTQRDDGREAAFPQRAMRVDMALRAPIAGVSRPVQRPGPVLAEQPGKGAWNLRFDASAGYMVAGAKKSAHRPGVGSGEARARAKHDKRQGAKRESPA